MAAFPPSSLVSVTSTIPSYLYTQYNDDENLIAFVNGYNGMTQTYLDWFNGVNLPIYTVLSGSLLDWVANGLYGILRPVFASVGTATTGSYNSVEYNALTINDGTSGSSSTYYTATDDIFKRVITWHFFKGDGRVFNISWLKRRIMRFLYGMNGTDVQGSSLETVTSASFGSPDGVTTVFQFLDNNGVPVKGLIVDSIYKNDWQGNQLQYSTPRTNYTQYAATSQGGNWITQNYSGFATFTFGIPGPDGLNNAARMTLTGEPNYDGFANTEQPCLYPLTGNWTEGVWMRGNGSVHLDWNGDGGAAHSSLCNLTSTWTFYENTVALSGTTYLQTRVLAYPVDTATTVEIGNWMLQPGSSIVGGFIPTTSGPVTVTDYSISNGEPIFAVAPEEVTSSLTWSGVASTISNNNTNQISVTISGSTVTIDVSAVTGVSTAVLQSLQYAIQGYILELPPQFTYTVTI